MQVKMGIYLSSPKTEKVSEDGENDRLRYGLSSMQGWRATMEDAVSACMCASVIFKLPYDLLQDDSYAFHIVIFIPFSHRALPIYYLSDMMATPK